jgi:hypothetical protein
MLKPILSREKSFIIIGAASVADTVFELPVKKSTGITAKSAKIGIDTKGLHPNGGVVSTSWLPFAAEAYQISPNIKDYVFAYVPALTSDVPNRNMQGFALRTLLEFEPELGCQRYKSFVGKPLFVEHDNQSPPKASGVILDSSIVAVPRYKASKVMLLVACDRLKAPAVANRILANGGSYSMGALTTALSCSICGGLLGPGVSPRTCTCYQTDYTDIKSYGKVYDGRLHYLLAVTPVFFEISSVQDPADHSAFGDVI